MIERKKYFERLKENRENGYPKIITGIRRCGKSSLFTLYIQYLKEEGIPDDRILSLRLDDDTAINLRNPIALGNYVRAFAKGKEMTYVFLDEIQKVSTILNPAFHDGKILLAKKGETEEGTISFVDVVLGLSREENIDLYVTGSNSHMLSSDVRTEFRDKAVEIPMTPLSFEEYYRYFGGDRETRLTSYLIFGGMPKAVLETNDVARRNYLKGLFNTTYFSDIIERNGWRNEMRNLDECADILASSIGSLLNVSRLANTWKSDRRDDVSSYTVDKYLRAFEDSFLVREAKRYDVKGRKEIGASRKYYFTDIGLRNARVDFAYEDKGPVLENAVYNELLYQGYQVRVGSFDSYSKNEENITKRTTNEIDFYATRGVRKLYIQVCLDVDKKETWEREIEPYIRLNDSIEKVLIVRKDIPTSRDYHDFLVMGASEFLLDYISKDI